MKKIYLILFCFFIINIYAIKDINIENIEYINRRIYNFNRGLDQFFFTPNVEMYIEIIPTVIKSHLNNFFSNIEELEDVPFSLIFATRQDKKKTIKKTIINTTLGCLGILDHTKHFDLIQQQQTLNESIITNKKYSIYIMMPLMGPGTLTTHACLIMHHLCNPVIYFNDNIFIYYILYIVNKKSNFVYNMNFFHAIMLDGYTFLKTAFLQKNLKTHHTDEFLTEPP